MVKTKVVIVDDEKQARNALITDLKPFASKIEIVGEASSVSEAISIINENEPNLVFLDINLGDGSGFNVIQKCSFKGFKVIFVTAYDQYAIKAFRVSALDFLLKPVDIDELKLAMDKFFENTPDTITNEVMEVYKQNYTRSDSPRKIVLKDLETIHIVKVDEIIYCEAAGIYTTFYLRNGEQLAISKNLKEYEEILTQFGFLRVHNSFLVNSSFITKFEKGDGGMLVLEGNKKIPVSQRKREAVVEFLKSL